MAVSAVERARVETRLRHLDETLARLRDVGPVDAAMLESDRLKRAAIERMLYLCIQDVLDIGAVLLRGQAVRAPGSYRDVVRLLGEAGVLELGFAKRIEPMADFRNILEHAYVDLDVGRLAEHAARLDDFVEFARQVAGHLGGESR